MSDDRRQAAQPDADDATAEGGGTVGPAARGRVPSSRTIARILLAVILVGGMVVGGWVAVDLLSVRSSLREARTALADVRGSLGDIDVEAAAESLDVAEAELSDAKRRADRWSWSIASIVPIAGPSVQVTREVVEVAGAAVDLADIAVAEGQQFLADGLDVVVVDGRIDLAPLVDAQELVASLPIDRLVAARDDLAAPRSAWLPDELREGRIDTLELADETLDLLLTAEGVTQALPSFLGADGPRRYFVGFQTSAELRGTGGLIGYWGVLGVDDGQVTFGQSEVFDPADTDADVGEQEQGGVQRIQGVGLSPVNPENADEEFLARYELFQAARYFSNINLDPDLPTTSKAILDLFELQTDQTLDGVLLLDPTGLQAMLEATGDTLPLSDDLATTFDYEDGLPTDRVAQFVTSEIYATLGADRTPDRDAALQEIGDTAFLQIFSGGWDSTQMLRAIAGGSRERHLQVFATDDEVQSAFQQVGATGELDVPDDADQIAVTANNAVGGKQDVHLGHEFAMDIHLSEPGYTDDGTLAARREAQLHVTVDNPLPASGMDPYIIGSCYVSDGPNECFDGEPGHNRTWFSLWTSPDTYVIDFDGEAGTSPWGYDNTFRDLRVVDYFLLAPPQSRASFTYELLGWVPLRQAPGSLVYELSWWRQSKAIPDLLDVTVSPPEGWAISDVEVVGGGSGRGAGVHGDGVEVTAEVTDGEARLTGTVTADTRLLVHLVGADG